jgi:hypothetical protein
MLVQSAKEVDGSLGFCRPTAQQQMMNTARGWGGGISRLTTVVSMAELPLVAVSVALIMTACLLLLMLLFAAAAGDPYRWAHPV